MLQITGAPIHLSYASDRAPTPGARVNANTVGLGGWSIDILHDYDSAQQLLTLGNGTQRRVKASQTKVAGADALLVASTDASQLYVFNAGGLHLRTIDTATGAILYRFTWNRAGLLAIVQGEKISTVIERDEAGMPISIRAPQGSITQLKIEEKMLSALVDPMGHRTDFKYDPQSGLLVSVTDARRGQMLYEYDRAGRLTRFVNPSGVTTTLKRADTAHGFILTTNTSLGRTSSQSVVINRDGSVVRNITDAAVPEEHSTHTIREMRAPDGTTTRIELVGDPRWGMQAPMIHALAVTTPFRKKTNAVGRPRCCRGSGLDGTMARDSKALIQWACLDNDERSINAYDDRH